MRSLLLTILAAVVPVLGSALVWGDVPASGPSSMPSARAVTEAAIAEALAALADRTISASQRTARVWQIADRHIDYEALSRLVLGQFWHQATGEQQTQFVSEFRRHIYGVYAQTIDGYEDEQVVVTDDREEARGDWTVRTTILSNVRANGKRQQIGRLDFRLRMIGGQWKAIDVTVEGISVILLYRAQFQAVAATGGMERVLQILRARNAPSTRPGGGMDGAK